MRSFGLRNVAWIALGMPEAHRAEVARRYSGEREQAAANAGNNKIGSLLFTRWGWPESEEGDGDGEDTRTRRPP